MTTYKEKTTTAEDLFEATSFNAGPMIPASNGTLQTTRCEIDSPALDFALDLVKWMFFFLPGTVVLHLVVSGTVLLASMGMLGAFTGLRMITIPIIVAGFLMMLGMGKLKDLKYLKVIGLTGAASFMTSIVLLSFSLFAGIDFFSLPLALSFIPIVVLAQVFRNIIDGATTNDK